VSRRGPGRRRRAIRLDPVGRTRHLGDVLDRVAGWLDDPSAKHGVTIGWGRWSADTGRPQRSLRLGRLRPDTGDLVLHPVLDHERVPESVTDFIVFHELCHHVAPPLTPAQARRRGEPRIHHGHFRALEARCPHVDESRLWVRRNLEWLLDNARRPSSR